MNSVSDLADFFKSSWTQFTQALQNSSYFAPSVSIKERLPCAENERMFLKFKALPIQERVLSVPNLLPDSDPEYDASAIKTKPYREDRTPESIALTNAYFKFITARTTGRGTLIILSSVMTILFFGIMCTS
jgi:hypothetical protein